MSRTLAILAEEYPTLLPDGDPYMSYTFELIEDRRPILNSDDLIGVDIYMEDPDNSIWTVIRRFVKGKTVAIKTSDHSAALAQFNEDRQKIAENTGSFYNPAIPKDLPKPPKPKRSSSSASASHFRPIDLTKNWS